MSETTHRGPAQVVSPERLRQILQSDGERCYCRPEHQPDLEWDVESGCPIHAGQPAPAAPMESEP